MRRGPLKEPVPQSEKIDRKAVPDQRSATICLLEGTLNIEVLIEGKEVESLIDTGASISIVSKSLLEKWGIPHRNTSNTGSILLPNGSCIKAVGTVMLEVTVNGNTLPMEFDVLREWCYDCIIGMDNLSRHGIVINCEKGEIAVKRKEKTKAEKIFSRDSINKEAKHVIC